MLVPEGVMVSMLHSGHMREDGEQEYHSEVQTFDVFRNEISGISLEIIYVNFLNIPYIKLAGVDNDAHPMLPTLLRGGPG